MTRFERVGSRPAISAAQREAGPLGPGMAATSRTVAAQRGVGRAPFPRVLQLGKKCDGHEAELGKLFNFRGVSAQKVTAVAPAPATLAAHLHLSGSRLLSMPDPTRHGCAYSRRHKIVAMTLGHPHPVLHCQTRPLPAARVGRDSQYLTRGDAAFGMLQRRTLKGSPAAAAATTAAASDRSCARPLAPALPRLRLARSSVVAAGRAAGQSVLDLSKLIKAKPQGFYLADASLAQLADCYAVVDGVRLPLHSQVLGAQCQVLRELFVSRREDIIASEVRGSKSQQRAALPPDLCLNQELLLPALQ